MPLRVEIEVLCHAQQRRSAAYDRDALSPTTELAMHDKHANMTRMRARQRRDDRGLGSLTTRHGCAVKMLWACALQGLGHAGQGQACHDKEFYVAIDLFSSKKKKK